MTAQSAGGVDVATQSASEKDSGASTQTESFNDVLLKEAAESGHTIGDVKLPPAKTEGESERETQGEEQTDVVQDETQQTEEQTGEESAETETQGESKEGDGKAGDTEGGEHASIEDQIKAFEAKGEKPPWYLTRIAEETRKKNDRTKDRDTALIENKRLEEENQALRSELTNVASQPMPVATGMHPLLGAWNEQGIQSVAQQCNHFIAWAERNRDGGTYVFGKDERGEDISRELTEEEVVNLKLGAEATLREGVPGRRDFLRQREQADAEAISLYSDFKNPNSALSREATAILRSIPALQLIPNIGVIIGDYVAGRTKRETEAAAKKNGQKDPASKIVQSVKERERTAPVVPKSRGNFTPRVKGADVEKAKEKLEKEGTKEAGEEFLISLGGAFGGQKAKSTERVQ